MMSSSFLLTIKAGHTHPKTVLYVFQESLDLQHKHEMSLKKLQEVEQRYQEQLKLYEQMQVSCDMW